MFDRLQNPLAFAARLLLALMFVMSGFSKLTGFDGTVGYIASKGLPLPQVGAVIALLVEIIGGLALVFGWNTRWAALVLAFFTLAASVIFHNFWAVPADQQMTQMLLFTKNISVIGGMLAVVAFGAGGWSLDARRR